MILATGVVRMDGIYIVTEGRNKAIMIGLLYNVTVSAKVGLVRTW